MNDRLFLIFIISFPSSIISLFLLNNDSSIMLTSILLIATMVCCIDDYCPKPELPEQKDWGPTISPKIANEEREITSEPYITVKCPSCGAEHMVTSPEYRPEAPHLIECDKCGEIFSII